MRNLTKFCIVVLLSVFFAQCTKEKSQNVVKCQIEGLEKGDKIILSVGTLTEDPEKVDSLIYEGQENIELKTSEKDVLADILILQKSNNYEKDKKGDSKHFFLEGYSELFLKGKVNEVFYANVSGGLYEMPELKKIQRIRGEIWKGQKIAISMFDKANVENTPKEVADSLMLKAQKIFKKGSVLSRDSIDPIEKAFVKKYPDKAYSAELLHYDYDLKMGKDFSKYGDAFMQLSERVRNNTRIGKTVARYIEARKTTDVGGTAPNFTLTDINGKEVNLFDYKGKFVLLEFWGTWCGGCHYAIPFLKELRKDFSEDKLTMFSIACNEQSEENWRKVVAEKEIDWAQTLAKDKSIQKMYAVQGYPTFFLINPEGKVIEKEMFSKDLMKKIREDLK